MAAPHVAKGLIRDPAEWARSWGWVSNTRARRATARLRALAPQIRDYYMAEGGGGESWADELEAIAKYLDPDTRGGNVGKRRS